MIASTAATTPEQDPTTWGVAETFLQYVARLAVVSLGAADDEQEQQAR